MQCRSQPRSHVLLVYHRRSEPISRAEWCTPAPTSAAAPATAALWRIVMQHAQHGCAARARSHVLSAAEPLCSNGSEPAAVHGYSARREAGGACMSMQLETPPPFNGRFRAAGG